MATGKARGGCLGFIGRVLGVLIVLGIVLGLWRYLGAGAGIGSPDWFGNAFDTVGRFLDWVAARTEDLAGRATTEGAAANGRAGGGLS